MNHRCPAIERCGRSHETMVLHMHEERPFRCGGMTLETPAMRTQEEAETAKRLEQIAAKREQRREKKSIERTARRERKKNG